jgi:hypothetical protein
MSALFAYRNFREAKDFESVLDELSGDDDGKPPLQRGDERRCDGRP